MDFIPQILLGLLLFGGTTFITHGNAACPDLLNALQSLKPQDLIVDKMTDPTCYDKDERPNVNNTLNITVQPTIYHIEVSNSEFTVYMTVTHTYSDNRLRSSSKRPVIMGSESLKSKIWTPNIYPMDSINSTVSKLQESDVIVTIKSTGEVIYSYKLVVSFYCSLNLRKFPFDWQKCSLQFSDWTYTKKDIVWQPVFGDSKLTHFSDFILDKVIISSSENAGPYNDDTTDSVSYSVLVVSLDFHRDVGYYLMDFFIPSYLLVCTAWVTFWLQADAGPPRATLGASTVIAFVTLHLGVVKDLPKVSYVKASDIWFLGTSCFIFFSLAEFAFVNVIWRRKKPIELKKEKSKYIFKSAVMPSVARKDLRKYESTQSLWMPSSENLTPLSVQSLNHVSQYNGNFRNSEVLQNLQNDAKARHSTISIPEDVTRDLTRQYNWKTMTPQEVAIWVDRKARIVFPLIFLIFNILYWTFVYVL